MKVLLVVKTKSMENLGVMYLSAVIKNAGHEAKIIDLDDADCSLIHFQPDIVGYSIMTGDREKFRVFNDRYHNGTRLTKPFKSIVGGPDPTFFTEGYEWADHICRGEGEDWISMLLRVLGRETSRKYYPYINSIPWPDRTDFPNMKVRDFITSRGCPYKCAYCYNEKWAEMFPEYKGVRVRSVDDVIAEIKSVKPEYVFFQDSCFAVNMEWMREFTEKYIFELGQGTINFNHGGGKEPIFPVPPYQCNFRPEQIDYERATLLKQSGCVAIRMALESASSRLREMVGRKMSLDVVMYAIGLLQGKKIQVMLQNIIGLPTATIHEDLTTLAFNIACSPTYAWVSIYQPYPGTELGDKCKKEGWYKGGYGDITDSFFETSHLELPPEHKEQLEVLQKVFALCADKQYLPRPEELTHKNFPELVHKIMRRDGDKKLYLNLLS